MLTWECAELILLDIDNCDEACPGEIERVLFQAVQVALLDVAGGTRMQGGEGAWRQHGSAVSAVARSRTPHTHTCLPHFFFSCGEPPKIINDKYA